MRKVGFALTEQQLFESEASFEEPIDKRQHQENFDRFWKAYPRKSGKIKAHAEWIRMNPIPDLQQVLVSIEEHLKSEQWQRGIIPHPATWLHQRRFEDEEAARPIQKRKILGHRCDPEFERRYREMVPTLAPRMHQAQVRAIKRGEQTPLLGRPARLQELIDAAGYWWIQYAEQGFRAEQIRGMVLADIQHALDQGEAWQSPLQKERLAEQDLIDEAEAIAQVPDPEPDHEGVDW